MAKKHFDEYYNNFCKSFFELNDTMKEIEEMYQNKMASEDMLENIKTTIAPQEVEFKILSYVNYLLNKPVRSKKQNKYDKLKWKYCDKKESKELKENYNIDKVKSNIEDTKKELKSLS